MRYALGALAVVAASGAAGALAADITPTHALMTSTADRQVNTVRAGSWAPPLPPVPPECGDVSTYKGGVIYGTAGDDVIRGGNQAQIIMGLGGNDTIYAGNSGDCLVGGDGDDTLYGGNGKDILLGGPGDDRLFGGNGKDLLDGGGGADACDGGNGKDAITDCSDPVVDVVMTDVVGSATPSPAPTPSEP